MIDREKEDTYRVNRKFANEVGHFVSLTICLIKRKENFFSLGFFSSAKKSCFITSAPGGGGGHEQNGGQRYDLSL
jgi:hypothetical protein